MVGKACERGSEEMEGNFYGLAGTWSCKFLLLRLYSVDLTSSFHTAQNHIRRQQQQNQANTDAVSSKPQKKVHIFKIIVSFHTGN